MNSNKPTLIAGIWCYKSKPDNVRVATRKDFIQNGQISFGRHFLILGYYDNEYEAYQVKANFKIENIEYWLNDNRVFVKND